jgi:hypothetical protein
MYTTPFHQPLGDEDKARLRQYIGEEYIKAAIALYPQIRRNSREAPWTEDAELITIAIAATLAQIKHGHKFLAHDPATCEQCIMLANLSTDAEFICPTFRCVCHDEFYADGVIEAAQYGMWPSSPCSVCHTGVGYVVPEHTP